MRTGSAASRVSAFLENSSLVETSYRATRSDGRRPKIAGVYRHSATDFRPHMLLQYIRLLRNAKDEQPEQYGAALYNQIDFLLTHAKERNGALVFENEKGFADGMVQAEYAELFFSLASQAARHGDPKLSEKYVRTAVKLAESLFLPAAPGSGGVQSSTGLCGPENSAVENKLPGLFFHSRAGAVHDEPGTALNQSAHVLRDLASMMVGLSKTDAAWPADVIPKEVLAEKLNEVWLSGLYHLAFSPARSDGAPSLGQYLERHQGAAGPHYTSYYEFNMARGQGRNIKAENTRHYHQHTLEVLAGLFALIDKHDLDPRARDARDRLLEFRDSTGAIEELGAVDTRCPLYQLYRSPFTSRPIEYFDRAFEGALNLPRKDEAPIALSSRERVLLRS